MDKCMSTYEYDVRIVRCTKYTNNFQEFVPGCTSPNRRSARIRALTSSVPRQRTKYNVLRLSEQYVPVCMYLVTGSSSTHIRSSSGAFPALSRSRDLDNAGVAGNERRTDEWAQYISTQPPFCASTLRRRNYVFTQGTYIQCNTSSSRDRVTSMPRDGKKKMQSSEDSTVLKQELCTF